jgi:hypothetical protein
MVADTWCGIIRIAAALARLTEIPNIERVTKEPIAAALAVRALGTGFPFICKKKLCEKIVSIVHAVHLKSLICHENVRKTKLNKNEFKKTQETLPRSQVDMLCRGTPLAPGCTCHSLWSQPATARIGTSSGGHGLGRALARG